MNYTVLIGGNGLVVVLSHNPGPSLNTWVGDTVPDKRCTNIRFHARILFESD